MNKKFSFEGSTKKCELAKSLVPHAPHKVGYYDTVARFTQDYFCPGVQGDGIEINVTNYLAGDADYGTIYKAEVSTTVEIEKAPDQYRGDMTCIEITSPKVKYGVEMDSDIGTFDQQITDLGGMVLGRLVTWKGNNGTSEKEAAQEFIPAEGVKVRRKG